MMRSLSLASLLLLSGCITLLPKQPPPPRFYVLEADAAAPLAGAPLDAVLGVAAPAGERAILGSDLVWRSNDELAIVGQSQWSARADAALQAMLVETILGQGRFRAIVRAGEARSDFELRWDVLDFEITDDMQAHFRADVRLMAMPGRRIVAQQIIAADAPVSARTSSAAANALARAAREGSARIGVFAGEGAAQASAASISR